MKENKSVQIKVRITPTEKDKLLEYCAANDVTVSQFIRNAIKEFFGGNKQ